MRLCTGVGIVQDAPRVEYQRAQSRKYAARRVLSGIRHDFAACQSP